MSNINEVRNMLQLGEDFHMCDVSSVTEEGIHLESWNEDVPKSDFEEVAELIYKDGYDITGFQLIEIPHPKVFCFGNLEKNEYFDVVGFWDNKWQFSYTAFDTKGAHNKPALSIAEAIEKNEFAELD